MNINLRCWLCLAVLVNLPGRGVNENAPDFEMCGTWRHGNQERRLLFNVTTGCEGLNVSANEDTMSVSGQFTGACVNFSDKKLTGSPDLAESPFCLTWDPVLQRLVLNLSGQTYSVCGPGPLLNECCSLSPMDNKASVKYGIVNGTIKGDIMKDSPQEFYVFKGFQEDCVKNFCSFVDKNPKGPELIEQVVMKSGMVGPIDLHCIQSSVMEVQQGFTGLNIHLTTPQALPLNMSPSVYLPPSLLPHGKKKAKVVCTYYNSSHFQGLRSHLDRAPLGNEVVAISVEGEVISNLPEPVRIRFWHHNNTGVMKSKCVFWDPRKDPKVHWTSEGCQTNMISTKETECACDHLTYFALLLEVQQQTVVRHLQALTWITALGCSISVISCLVLMMFLNKRRQSNDGSVYIHYNLVVAMLLLSVLFLFAGVVGNLDLETVCQWYGAALHYALLCTFAWMAIEVFNTFWLIYMVMKLQVKRQFLNVVGFGVPFIPVVIMLSTKFYGQRRMNDETGNLYSMCWIKADGFLAHCIINVGFFVLVFFSGMLMLCLVLRQVHNRSEWKQNRVTFFSILGLSLLFGSSWGLGFLGFGALFEVIQFLFCINSLQGFFLLLRFGILEWFRKKEKSTEKCSMSSTGQHMLPAQDRM